MQFWQKVCWQVNSLGICLVLLYFSKHTPQFNEFILLDDTGEAAGDEACDDAWDDACCDAWADAREDACEDTRNLG